MSPRPPSPPPPIIRLYPTLPETWDGDVELPSLPDTYEVIQEDNDTDPEPIHEDSDSGIESDEVPVPTLPPSSIGVLIKDHEKLNKHASNKHISPAPISLEKAYIIGTRRLSRDRDAPANTVFEEPSGGWQLRKTRHGSRIVSADRVETFQVTGSKRKGYRVTRMGRCYAIFRREGHLEAKESFATAV